MKTSHRKKSGIYQTVIRGTEKWVIKVLYHWVFMMYILVIKIMENLEKCINIINISSDLLILSN